MQDPAYQSGAPELPWDRFVYTTHQQMASSVSYNKDKVMTAAASVKYSRIRLTYCPMVSSSMPTIILDSQ